ncbi:MAG: hypothetical protein EXS63_09670 [Candidatus Omnitrophica bacterium]|nr:hypothetical protein [Candidatus Omnitrophota bacterium]
MKIISRRNALIFSAALVFTMSQECFVYAGVKRLPSLPKSIGNVPLPEIDGEYTTTVAMHRTGGNGSKTLMHRGEFLVNELDMKISEALPSDWRSDTQIHARKIDDPQIDKRHDVHLLNFTSELYNPWANFTVGDFFADLSQYTMSQSLEGLQGAAKTDWLDLKGLAGYSQRADEGRQFTRYVFGGKSEALLVEDYGVVKNLEAGFNFSNVMDDRKSIENKFIGENQSIKGAVNRVGSFNYHAVLWDKTNLEGEIAKSWIDEDTTAGSDVNRKTGTALRLNTMTKFSKKAKWKLNYEQVSSAFNSLSGSAVPDRGNAVTKFDYKWTKELGSAVGYKVSYDKLENSVLEKRTYTNVPTIALNYTAYDDIGFIRDLFSQLYWEMRKRMSQDDGPSQIDFQSQEVGLSNEFKIKKMNYTADWSVRKENDDLNQLNDRLINSGSLGVRFRKQIGSTEAQPSFRWQINYEDKLNEGGRDLTQNPSFGLMLHFSKSLSLEQRHSVEIANRSVEDTNALKYNAFVGLNYKIPQAENVTLKVTYEHTNFAHKNADERFMENNLQAQMILDF